MSAKTTNWMMGLFCAAVLALMTFGLVMLASTSYATVHHNSAFFYAKRQALWMGLGLIVCALVSRLDYHRYRQYAWPLFAAALVLLLGVLILGRRINGAARWFAFGPVRLQPSEIAKYVLVVVLAFWLEKVQRPARGQLQPRIQHWWWGVLAPLALTGGILVLIVVEPDLGTTLLLAAVVLVLMWVAGAPSRWLAGLVGTGGLAAGGLIIAIFKYGMFQKSYQVQRILHWWYWDDLGGSNYQQWTALLAFGSGGVGGLGLGNSRMKLAYLPEAHTDFIFPIVGEELGVIATLAVLAAFCVLIGCGMALTARAPDFLGMLLGTGIITVIGLQAIINIAVVTCVVPNKGMALPFISYGGSNLVMTLAALGVALNVFQQAVKCSSAVPTSMPRCLKPDLTS
jgi:cell division protein FtsW